MIVPKEIYEFSAEQGLTFLEHLAHNLTIELRYAASIRKPHGSLSHEQCHKTMYWINESTHNVVQLTRDIRIGRENWNAEDIANWVKLWINYDHADRHNMQAVVRSIHETLYPYRPD